MKNTWLIALGLVPVLAGCSVFESNVVPPSPAAPNSSKAKHLIKGLKERKRRVWH